MDTAPMRHLGLVHQLVQILGVVGETAALYETERLTVEQHEQVLGRLIPTGGGTEVARHRLGRGLVVPPPCYVRL